VTGNNIVTRLQVMACVLGSSYAFRVIAEGLMVCPFCGSFCTTYRFAAKTLWSHLPHVFQHMTCSIIGHIHCTCALTCTHVSKSFTRQHHTQMPSSGCQQRWFIMQDGSTVWCHYLLSFWYNPLTLPLHFVLWIGRLWYSRICAEKGH